MHLNCTQRKQRQYKHNWRCTHHNNNTKHRQHNNTSHTNHPPTHNNQPKDKNIVILQININGIRNKIEELKKTRTQHPTGHHHNTRNHSHRRLKHQKYPTTPPYAQTESTNKERTVVVIYTLPWPLLVGAFDVPACGPPASISVHLVSSAVNPVGSVHKSRGDNVVRMWVQLKR